MSQEEQKVVVLVADDEPSTLALVASHVRSKGYKVLEASDGDLAWQLAHEHLPDLVVLDVMMPGMSGWEVCRKIREAVSLAHTGVIMLTGIGENLNEMTSPLYGADTYLDKPFEFGKLDECIRDVLARRKKDHAMGRPAETERPSSRPPAPVAARGNGMIVTSVAGLAERAAAQVEAQTQARAKASRPKASGPGKTKAAASTAKPPVKAKVAAAPAPNAKVAAKAKAATRPAAGKGKSAAKAKSKPVAKAPAALKAKTVAKAKPTAKALAKGKVAGKAAVRKASPKPAARPVKKAAKLAAKGKGKKAAPKAKASKAASAKAAPIKATRAEPKKAAPKAKAARRAPSRNEGARA